MHNAAWVKLLQHIPPSQQAALMLVTSAGTEITIIGYQAKSGAHRANGRDLILADGSHLFMGSSESGVPGEPAKAEPAPQ